MPSSGQVLATLAALLTCFEGAVVRAASNCDVTDLATSLDLRNARLTIDAACPCATAVKPGLHVSCAKPVVDGLIGDGFLSAACKKEALNHAKKSICGRKPGAVVCCRFKVGGKTAHKIASATSKCASTAKITSCVSALESVPAGCSATDCVPPVCGNGIVEPGETCEPPQADVCDATCQLVTCERPASSCGNGILESGETCEPAGAGSCGWDCAPSACAAPEAGEVAVACSSEANATLGAGARGAEYLVAWNDTTTWRNHPDIVGRRFDADAAPADAIATIVSADVDCGGQESGPAVGSDGAVWVVGWAGSGPASEAPGAFHTSAYARPLTAAGTLGSLDELARLIPFGMCTGAAGEPISVAPAPLASATSFAVTWQLSAACLGYGTFVDPDGMLLDYATTVPSRTPMTIGFLPPGSLPAPLSDSSANLATAGTTTLAVWHAHLQSTTPPYASDFKVVGAVLAADGTTSSVAVSARQPGIGGGRRPSIAAATDRFLVAWADGPVDVATDVRAMRVGAPGGPLDPDGGILLASTVGGAAVVGGPVVAFDGTQWLVVWTEAAVGGNDLRAVAVAADGTVLDAVPRLVASGIGASAPAIASAGDGRSLVVYAKPDGGRSAVRARLVAGN